MTEKSKVLEESIDQQRQYSRRNCLLIHGVEENSNEDTDKLVLDKNDLEINLTEVAIDRTHRIGDPKKKKKKAQPIIVKFVRYYDRKEVFSEKKYLKGKGISITESLTNFRMKKLEEAREKYGFKNVWSIDGRILFKDANDKPSVYYNQLAQALWEKNSFFGLCYSCCYLLLGLFSFGVIVHLVFFNLMINGYMPLIEIFLFSSFP